MTIEERLDLLEDRIKKLELNIKSKKRKETDNLLNLLALKEEFINSKPLERTDIFTDYELVFWLSFLLKKTNKSDKIDNIKELSIRSAKIRKMIEYFSNFATERKIKNTNEWARVFIKDFLQYCVEVARDTENKPLNFYQATSDWAINSFTHKVIDWRKIKNLKDVEA